MTTSHTPRDWQPGRWTLTAVLVLSIAGCARDDAHTGTDVATNNSSAETAASTGMPPVLFDAPEFALIDQSGNSFGTEQLQGRVWIANFFFTQCAATCPMQTDKMAKLQERMARRPDRDRIRLLSITVDPERDNLTELSTYARAYRADTEQWKFLTGERAELVRISQQGFKLPVSDRSATPITHSSKFILVDSQGRIRGYYDVLQDDEYEMLLRHLRLVLEEPGHSTSETVHVGVPPDVFDPSWLDRRMAEQLATREKTGVYHDFSFVDSLPASRITFVNRAVPDATRNFKKCHYDHGNGIAAADVDGDGLPDLYFVSQVGGNQLWRNLGDGRFEDITESSGTGLSGRVCVSASFADTDNDGDPDLYVTTTRHGNVFFENDGQGRFRDVTAIAGLDYSGHSSSADFFDYDRDGKLDLFLSNVGVFTTDEIAYSGNPTRKEDPYFVGRDDAFAGHLFPDRVGKSILYRNEGQNRFRDVTQETGLQGEGWFGDATPLDINADGWPDLYAANMQGDDTCFVNQGGKRFAVDDQKLFKQSVWGGMGVKSMDYDNDGSLDLMVTNMHADMWLFPQEVDAAWEKNKTPRAAVPESYLLSRHFAFDLILGNALFSKDQDGKFADVSSSLNTENYWPWGISVGDLNADGFEDVLITSCMNYPFRYHVNSVLLNDRGKIFRDAEFILGIEPRRGGRTATPWFDLDASDRDKDHELAKGRSGTIQVWGALGSRSAVILDLDQDGDLDIVTNDFHSPPVVLLSNLSDRHKLLRYLQVKLHGKQSNRDGLGARVELSVGSRVLTRVHDGQSGYLSQSSLPLYFGLDGAEAIDKITVVWPSGNTQSIEGPIPANQCLEIVESGEAVGLRLGMQ